MRNYMLTGIATLVIGAVLGLYLGWVQFPVEYQDSTMCQLAFEHQETYTVMVARGYRRDRDIFRARERLAPLSVDNDENCDYTHEFNNEYQFKIENEDQFASWVVYLVQKRDELSSSDTEGTRALAILAVALGGQLSPELEDSYLPEAERPSR